MSTSPHAQGGQERGPQRAHLTLFPQPHLSPCQGASCDTPPTTHSSQGDSSPSLGPCQLGKAIRSENFLADLTMVSQAAMSQLQKRQGQSCGHGAKISSWLDQKQGLGYSDPFPAARPEPAGHLRGCLSMVRPGGGSISVAGMDVRSTHSAPPDQPISSMTWGLDPHNYTKIVILMLIQH